MDYPKSTPSVGLVNGKFVDENPVNGSPGSLIPAVWGNAVTEELLNVVQAGGLEPVEAEHDQLLKAIRTIIQSSLPPEQIRTTLAAYGITDAYTKAEVEALFKNATALPVGAMMAFPKGDVPPGYLEVDGSVQSIAIYPDLAAYLGTTFNRGDEGVGSFRLPESRGEFLRGWDHGRGVDGGRTIGSYQLDDFKSHKHPLDAYVVTETGVGPVGGVASSGNIYITETAFVGGAETRPRNLSVMWCIKAWNAPINQASIDVSALAAQVQNSQKFAIVGSHKGLTVSASGLNSLVTIAADQLVVGNDATFKNLSAVSLNINAAIVGVNGLDAGALAASTWYSIWVISGTAGTAGLLSLSTASPTLPAGYTLKARVGWIKTDATANKYPLSFTQVGKRVQYKVVAGSNVASLPVMATTTASVALWTAISVTSYLPPTAPVIDVGIQVLPLAGQISWVYVVPSNSYSTTVSINSPAALAAGSYQTATGARTVLQLESSSIYWGSSTSSGGSMTVYCAGWEDSL